MQEAPVALKFMHDSESYKREVVNRKKVLYYEMFNQKALGRLDAVEKANKNTHLIYLRPNGEHDDLMPSDLAPFPQIKLSGGSSNELKYLIVMDKGMGDLSDIISHDGIAGRNMHLSLHIAISVAKCLQFINEDCRCRFSLNFARFPPFFFARASWQTTTSPSSLRSIIVPSGG